MKMSDVANGARMPKVYDEWSARVFSEFYLQGDQEVRGDCAVCRVPCAVCRVPCAVSCYALPRPESGASELIWWHLTTSSHISLLTAHAIMQAKAGLPISSFMDRSNPKELQCQSSFLQYIVGPLYAVGKRIWPDLSAPTTQLDANKQALEEKATAAAPALSGDAASSS